MNAVVEKSEPKLHGRLTGAVFINSIAFAGQASSVAIGRNCDSIVPARLEADGMPVTIDKGQRADGLLIRRRAQNRATNKSFVEQTFVPWANVGETQYGE